MPKTKPTKYPSGKAARQNISLDPDLHAEWVSFAEENHIPISEIAAKGVRWFLTTAKAKGNPERRAENAR